VRRLLLLTFMLVAVSGSEGRRRILRVRCEDGGSLVPVGQLNERQLFCDADGQANGVCTVDIPCGLGLLCPPCCSETITVPVGKAVRLGLFNERLRCVRHRSGA
jgi:hypothetical protein